MKRNNPMDIDNFIKIHNPENGSEPWIDYNESIITPDYKIIECIPSHEKCMSNCIIDKYNISIPTLVEMMPTTVSPLHYMIEKYHYISIWYNSIIIFPGALMDTTISKMINDLYRAKLLSPDIFNHISIAHDYTTARFFNDEISHNDYLQFMERINNRRS